MLVPGGVKAGKISKPYGLQGKLSIILNPEAGKHIETDNPLFIDIDGQRVPFFVEEFDQISSDQAIVKFEFIGNIETAREYTGCEVFLDPAQKYTLQGDNNDLDAVIGYQAFDQDMGLLGEVLAYIHHEMNPVLMVDFNGKELIVPAVDEFIKQINHKKRSIHFILPDGLTTL